MTPHAANLTYNQTGTRIFKSAGGCESTIHSRNLVYTLSRLYITTISSGPPTYVGDYKATKKLAVTRDLNCPLRITSTFQEDSSCGTSISYWSIDADGGIPLGSATSMGWSKASSLDGITSAKAAVQNRVLTTVADVQANFVVTAVEMNQTVKMIATRARDIAKIFYYIKRGSLSQAKQYAWAASKAIPIDTEIRKLYAAANGADSGSAKRLAKQVEVLKLKRLQNYRLAKQQKLAVPAGFWTRDPRFRGKTDLAWQNVTLEYFYGWCNLMYDAEGMARWAAQRFYEHPKTFSVSRAARVTPEGYSFGMRQETFPGEARDYYYPSPVPNVSAKFRVDEHYGAHVRAGLCCKVLSQDPRSYNQTVGNIPANIYELTSLSFVLDYFVDVGTYLKNLTALAGLEVLTGFVSWSDVTVKHVTVYPEYGGAATVVDGQLGSISKHCPPGAKVTHNYTRDVWTGAQPPIQIGTGLCNIQRILTSVALIKQRLFSNSPSRRYTSR